MGRFFCQVEPIGFGRFGVVTFISIHFDAAPATIVSDERRTLYIASGANRIFRQETKWNGCVGLASLISTKRSLKVRPSRWVNVENILVLIKYLKVNQSKNGRKNDISKN